jgi:hypothetical protein
MKYWHVCINTEYCGTEENFIVISSDDKMDTDILTQEFIDTYYGYSYGSAGLILGTDEEVENGEADETDEDYINGIWENSYCEEITKEEFDKYNEYGYDLIEL